MAAAPLVTVQGAEIPRMGFGTWQLRDCAQAVRHALELGYRHIDTASAYGNEDEVGRGLAASGIPTDEVFLTTKAWTDDLEPSRLVASAERSLATLGVERIDLLLVHWPSSRVPLEATLEAMLGLRERGLIRLLGVSNFPPGLFRRALELAPVVTDQVEYHPFLGQDALIALAERHDSTVTAYSPIARGKVTRDPVLREIAAAHGVTPAQVSLRWLLRHERVVVVPKAADPRRRAENLAALELELSEEDLARIDALPKDRRDSDPAWAPDWAA